jgi:predicted  nucleic acid-binding Zn-ribbon protein
MAVALSLQCALLLGVACAAHASLLRQTNSASGFVKALDFQHTLRVCNAYPYQASLDVYRTKDKLTDSPMAYKSCKDFKPQLKTGDKLEFKVGDATAGTFAVSDLPQNDAVLLLIVHRHDQVSTAVSFESHVFANLGAAQVAVIDTYKGSDKSTARITDHNVDKNHSRSEELRFSSIVAVTPGVYDVELDGTDGAVKAKNQFVALGHESYVVIRTGVESKTGASFPQDLLVYPNSDPAQLHSGVSAPRITAVLMVLVGVFAAWA